MLLDAYPYPTPPSSASGSGILASSAPLNSYLLNYPAFTLESIAAAAFYQGAQQFCQGTMTSKTYISSSDTRTDFAGRGEAPGPSRSARARLPPFCSERTLPSREPRPASHATQTPCHARRRARGRRSWLTRRACQTWAATRKNSQTWGSASSCLFRTM